MLSRTADHLYWMSRYTERAENTARMLDVNYQTALLGQTEAAEERSWRGLLSISELLPRIEVSTVERHSTSTAAAAGGMHSSMLCTCRVQSTRLRQRRQIPCGTYALSPPRPSYPAPQRSSPCPARPVLTPAFRALCKCLLHGIPQLN